MRLLGTIRHNDRNDDIDRVPLYAGDDLAQDDPRNNGNVWAACAGDPADYYDTGVPIASVGRAWDFSPAEGGAP